MLLLVTIVVTTVTITASNFATTVANINDTTGATAVRLAFFHAPLPDDIANNTVTAKPITDTTAAPATCGTADVCPICPS